MSVRGAQEWEIIDVKTGEMETARLYVILCCLKEDWNVEAHKYAVAFLPFLYDIKMDNKNWKTTRKLDEKKVPVKINISI